MSTKTLMTAEEFLTYHSTVPCELVRGEVIEMGPSGFRHGIVCSAVGTLLRTWSRTAAAGFVAVNDTGVVTEHDPDTVRGPDCLFIRKERIPGGIPSRGFLPIVPDLAVEVVSPSDRWSEVIAKAGEYLEAGVREVWVIDPDVSQVQVFRPDRPPVILGAHDTLTSETLPGFTCSISEVFAEM